MATRAIVPRANDEGGIGTTLKKWATGFIKVLTVDTVNAITPAVVAGGTTGFTLGGGAKTLTVDETVTLSSKLTAPAGGVLSGTYTPTITAGTNIEASTSNAYVRYVRVGNIITVSGSVLINTVAAGAADFRIDLPVASNLTSVTQLSGSGVEAANFTGVRITGVTSTDDAQFVFNAPTTGNEYVVFSFSYSVL